ncbi:MAG: TM2 domain-containing protein [Aeromicrobium sp.]|uniref:TM2 domain-containing protein n=1 Tax=Aeromicrobium sp. TaxID=1871063 RepID=UPI003C4EE6ED
MTNPPESGSPGPEQDPSSPGASTPPPPPPGGDAPTPPPYPGDGPQPPPGYGHAPPPPGYGQAPAGPQPYAQQQPYGYAPPGAPFAYGANPQAPYGYDPKTGLPFSDKQKLVAGLLQILIPLGIGRMYAGHVGLGIGQLAVTILTCGIGALWPFIDGIVILAGDPKDSNGLPLRP